LRRGELLGCPPKVGECRRGVVAIATQLSPDELCVSGWKARFPGFERPQAGRQVRFGLLPSWRGGGSQRLGPHAVGEAFGEDAADLVGDAHRVLGERQGVLDAPRGQGDVGSRDGEPVGEDEPAEAGTDGVRVLHVAVGGRVMAESSAGPSAEGETGVEDDLLA
jgi:hypothetical protein